MTKDRYERKKSRFVSIRVKFIIVFFISITVAIGAYFAVHRISYNYIDKVYTEESNRDTREEQYIEDLRAFIEENDISSEDTSKLSEWAKRNKYVYLLIYKDEELLYTSDDKPPVTEEEKEEEQPPEEKPSDESPENPPETPDDDAQTNPEEAPDADTEAPEDENASEDGKTDSEEGSADSGKNPDKEDKPSKEDKPGGVTIDYPTREELFEYARKNGMHPLKMSDGTTVLAYLTEFTEYLYYDIANIASIIVAVLIVLITLALYFQIMTTRIIRLGNEVNKVADGDVYHVIDAKGDDEISKLSLNVDNMRESMIKNFQKEKEALDANNELITSMSHDIRTPLTVLLGYIDAMQSRTENDSEMQNYLKAAESTALRLKKLSDDMFGYFLVFGGRELEIKMENYDAATLIDQMLFEHVMLMRESGYTVELDGPDYIELAALDIRTDAQKLVRIFDNVFSNIYKYADKNSPVSISAKKRDDVIDITFSNEVSKNGAIAESNGIGLKTCKKLGEYIDAVFKCDSDDEKFVANLTLKLVKNAEIEN